MPAAIASTSGRRLLGSPGHALVEVIEEARLFHAYARTAAAPVELKGGNPLTENYSALSPELLRRFDGRGSTFETSG